MKTGAWMLCICLAPLLAKAADGGCNKSQKEALTATAGGFLVCSEPAPESLKHPSEVRSPLSPLSAAIAGAAKKGWIEAGVEASANALIACQNEKSVVLTTPSMRSDSQQAHCFRF
ncbi:hypothetical protein HSX11_16855 [Oxalobacteraceae bacterium]|nr:hypothetical protein [Oxalobacteraceae bacterium]